MNTAMVEMISVSKQFGGTPVLRAIDLAVSPGQKVCIIGPSGSGKSTLLRLLMTLEKPNSGSVRIDGDFLFRDIGKSASVTPPLHELRRIRKKIGMVFQHFNLFPHLSVLDNITLAPRLVLRIPSEEAGDRARSLLEMVGLGNKADAYPVQLSGGQKQRVAIARALAMEPQLMLFDEVTSALDPELVGEVLTVIRELAHQGDMTLLLVTHEMRFAREIADRVLFLDHGSIVEDNPPDIVFAEPEHARTREFLRSVLDA